MLFEWEEEVKGFKPVTGMNIVDSFGGCEKDLENYLREIIGDLLFPEYLVFGNERSFQKEADLFAVNSSGDLVIFELKVDGLFDRGKIYQALDYAQHFSFWRYKEMNDLFQKCYSERDELMDAFEDHFGFRVDRTEFNKKQKVIVISHSSSEDTGRVSRYWKGLGLDIEEYYYRFYAVSGKRYFEISNELWFQQNSYNCWINTCSRYIPKAYLDMVKGKKAATYGDRRSIIGPWMNKSYIFLYHNGCGVIGVGRGTATIQEFYNKELQAEERSIKLSNFISGVDLVTGDITTWLPPAKIKELLQRDFYFPNSLVTLSELEAEKLYKECKNNLKCLYG
ncbi:MAG: hypothetical protein H0X47_19235 [Nitrospirales bacterium]|nr:hypothetical protein [Nitrospirales bacterium]